MSYDELRRAAVRAPTKQTTPERDGARSKSPVSVAAELTELERVLRRETVEITATGRLSPKPTIPLAVTIPLFMPARPLALTIPSGVQSKWFPERPPSREDAPPSPAQEGYAARLTSVHLAAGRSPAQGVAQ